MKRTTLIAELATLFDNPDEASNLLEDAGLPVARLRTPFGSMSPHGYWRYVCAELDRGLVVDGCEKLVCAAAELYPGNATLRSYAPPIGTHAPRTVVWNVPELPPHYVSRDDDAQSLIRTLCGGTKIAIGIAGKQHGLHGMGGIGKTVLAVTVARSHRLRQRFVDGIYWLSIGQTPKIVQLQSQLARGLEMQNRAFDDPADGKHQLSEFLFDKKVLIIFDDVWESEHVGQMFVVGESGRILVTTRILDVLTYRDAAVHSLDVLSEKQSLILLSKWANIEIENLPRAAKMVAEACGHLPIALAMAGALVRKPTCAWEHVIQTLQDARLDRLRGKLPAYPYRNVYQVIQTSVTQLAAEGLADSVEQCYEDLGLVQK